jgi:hypothetical protein
MATIQSESAPPSRDAVRNPPFLSKAELLEALEGSAGGGRVAVAAIAARLSNTDTTTWPDRGSHVT